MQNNLELMQAAYDRVAGDYDAQWSVHVAGPQDQLTRRLELRPGERCADLGCGTGRDTLRMLKLVTPGEVVGVDCSGSMLAAARQRAQAAGLALTTCCESVERFVALSQDASFDVITLRFCLGYLNWGAVLPCVPRMLRPGGRIGLLTILASSAPQAYATYQQMVRALGLPDMPLTALPSLEDLVSLLDASGAKTVASWTHSFRLLFPSGERLGAFLQGSGIAASPALAAVPRDVAAALWADFAERIECYRVAEGIPLDFYLAGAVATAT
jgi:ubiquinone/menaquinone biosynthesis C-methylase UbiE